MGAFGDLEAEPQFFYFFLCADEALGHGVGGGEIGAGDLGHAEAADHLEGQHGLLLGLEGRVAGHEHQRQGVVELSRIRGLGEAQAPGGALVEGAVPGLPAQPVEGPVARRHREPGGRPLGDAVQGPARQGGAEGVLDGILHDVEAGGAEQTRQPGRELAGLAPEEIVDERVRVGHPAHIRWIWRTSMRPP